MHTAFQFNACCASKNCILRDVDRLSHDPGEVVNLPIIGDKPPIIFDIEFSNKVPPLSLV